MTSKIIYPVSASYVADWDVERAVAEAIANALDTGEKVAVHWRDGTTVIRDRGAGLGAGALVFGESSKDVDQIGQFGEGLKLAMLVAAREHRAMTITTAGVTLRPHIEPHSFGLDHISSDVLAVDVTRNRRRRGTVIEIATTSSEHEQARRRFRQLWDRRWTPPPSPGRTLADEPGVIRIGGVLVTERSDLTVGYDFANSDAKHLMNRDRSVLDAWELSDMIGRVTARGIDADSAEAFTRAALHRGLADIEAVRSPLGDRSHQAWKTARRRVLASYGRKICWADSKADLDAQDRAERNWVVLTPPDPDRTAGFRRVMEALDVPSAGRGRDSRQRTIWIARRRLEPDERRNLNSVLRAARRRWGADSVGRVRVYTHTDEGDFDGFYDPETGDIAVARRQLADLTALRVTVAHEIAHRRAHQLGREHQDRTRGFEQTLSEMAADALVPARQRRREPDSSYEPQAPHTPPGSWQAPHGTARSQP